MTVKIVKNNPKVRAVNNDTKTQITKVFFLCFILYYYSSIMAAVYFHVTFLI